MPMTRATLPVSASLASSLALLRHATAAIMQSTIPGSDAGRPAATIDPCSATEVGGGVKPEKLEPQEQPAQIRLPFLAARAGDNLHHDGIGDPRHESDRSDDRTAEL